MAMRTKARFTLLGIVALLAAGVTMWYLTIEKWAIKYQQTNASWQISGLCTSSQDGVPISDAQITAYFSEPVTLRHKLHNAPLKTTTVVTNTDDQGRFNLVGEGGYVQIKVRAKGYLDPEPWEDWRYSAMNGVTEVITNITVSLQLASQATQEGKTAGGAE